MKIGIDIRNIGKQRTGDEVVFFNLVRSLRNTKLYETTNKLGFSFYLFTDITNKNRLKEIKRRFGIIDGDNFEIISLKAKNKFFWNFLTLPSYLRKNPVDIYHTQYITPFFISKKIKIVNHIHDISFKIYSKFIKKSDLFFLNILIPMAMRRADKIIAVSEFTKNEIIKHYNTDPKKIDVVYNSTDLIKEKKDIDVGRIRKKYNLPEKFILYVGTLQPRKNIPILIEAYVAIKKRLPEIELVIAGDRKAHNFDKKIDEAILKFGLSEKDIIFSGFLDKEDKLTVYSLAHVLVAPSLYEGFGITSLEAMTGSIPVLVSNIPPHREVSENAALYFDPENLDEFKKKLYNICVDVNLRNQLVGLESARVNFFSWEKSAKKLLEIYKSLK